MQFADRLDAGRRLAAKLTHIRDQDVAVLGLPRGGVPVAFEVAQALGAPLDVIIVRKLGVPFQPELAMGAIGEDGVLILNRDVIHLARISDVELAGVERRERAVLEAQARRFRANAPRVPLRGRTAIIVDDGMATGSTARAACQVARAQGAARVVLAVPVAPRSAVAEIAGYADEVVCVETPDPFFAVGQWYRDFSQTSDGEVLQLLDLAAKAATSKAEMSKPALQSSDPYTGPDPPPSAVGATPVDPPGQPEATYEGDPPPSAVGASPVDPPGQPEATYEGDPPPSAVGASPVDPPGQLGGFDSDPLLYDQDVEVRIGSSNLAGHLSVPAAQRGYVIFAHGSGSSRMSPRDRLVATVLNEAGLATLLFDLLTPAEELDRSHVFDIELLAARLEEVTLWLKARPETRSARIGYFGASTGAGAALLAASKPESSVAAIVSRGGRPDLAGPSLAKVRAPTLLIVGGNDGVVLELNRQAQTQLRCENELAVVPGATHLFAEPGTLEAVASLARDFFVRHLALGASAGLA
ncbi:MAG: dienelactone hydrolase family protein [Actinobacteria bacterium]|nr:dienelactone hydrolase family protein [Actinomycetota bacterium]